MTLSDDEMLNDLADEMLHEIKHDTVIHTTRQDANNLALFAGPPRQDLVENPTSSGPYDINRMMSQMMPMMSQFLGNSDFKQSNREIETELALEDILPKYLPPNEAQEWIQTIRSDQVIMESEYLRNGIAEKVHSYSYGNKTPSSSFGFEIETLLRTFVKEGITSSKLTERYNSKRGHSDLMEQALDTRLLALFKIYLQKALMEKLANDSDFQNLYDQNSDKVERIVAIRQ